MILRTAVSVAALTIALGVAPQAMAQTQPRSSALSLAEAPKAPVAGQIVVQEPNTVLARQDLIGQTVYASDKAKVGTISDLILSKDGKSVDGFVIGVGGFLGIGEKSVALKMDKLKMASGANGAMELSMDMTKDELSNAPTFKSRKDVEAGRKRPSSGAANSRRGPCPAPSSCTTTDVLQGAGPPAPSFPTRCLCGQARVCCDLR